MQVLVVSDLHWAGPSEQRRRGYEQAVIRDPFQRLLAAAWRKGFWLADPMAHNHRLDRIVERNPSPDVVVANGDYTVDSAFIGIADDPACESAGLCLQRLRATYGERLLVGIGDHELGKHSFLGGAGGPRFESWRRVGDRLGIEPVWRRDFGRYAFVAVPSTPMALPAFEPELLDGERALWHGLRERLVAQVRGLFAGIPEDRRIVLFCHDPTALPFLAELPEVAAALPRFDATVIGHLHSPFLFGVARRLAGFPEVRNLGSTMRRYTTALRQASSWRRFRIVFCPSPTGAERLKDGGWLTGAFEPDSSAPIAWTRHRLPWQA